jgi:LCP family protein required for cell wall assembly
VNKKKYWEWNYISIGIVAILGVLLILGAISLIKKNRMNSYFARDKVISFLLVGTDFEVSKGHTDTIIIGYYNTKTQRLGLVIVPRDIRVKMKNLYHGKINSIYSEQGLPALVSYLERMTGYPIQFYAVLDIKGMVKLVDLLGPVRVFNDKPLKYVDTAQNLYIDLPAGELDLDGEKAMQYVRFRNDERGDFGRSERQLELIQILARKALREKDLVKNIRLLRTMIRFVHTNLTVDDVLWFYRKCGTFQPYDIETMRIPGTFLNEKGKDYIVIEPEVVKSRVRDFYEKLGSVKPAYDPRMINVQVLNGTSTPGLAAKVRNRLLYFGYNVVEFGNADHDQYKKTYVFDRSGNYYAAQQIGEIIKCENVYPKINKLILIDVTVIVGEDFIPKKVGAGP